MRQFLFWLAMHLPARVISEGERPYLERYYVGQAFGWRCYLHRFVASDPDGGCHDHPWLLAFSFLLVGWYYEVRRWGVRSVRWFNMLTGDTFHRVVVGDDTYHALALHDSSAAAKPPTEVWSLFIHRAEDAKQWGFWRQQGEHRAHWFAFTYPGKTKNTRWELVAPKGRDLHRDAHGVAYANQAMYPHNSRGDNASD